MESDRYWEGGFGAGRGIASVNKVRRERVLIGGLNVIWLDYYGRPETIQQYYHHFANILPMGRMFANMIKHNRFPRR